MQQPSEIAILSREPLQNRDFVSKIAIFRALREFCAQVVWLLVAQTVLASAIFLKVSQRKTSALGEREGSGQFLNKIWLSPLLRFG